MNSAAVPQSVINSLDWQRAMSFIAGDPTMAVSVEGFTDCVGSDPENLALRAQRVEAVTTAMAAAARRRVLFSFTATAGSFLAANDTPEGRARNRAVVITFRSSPPGGVTDACDVARKASSMDEYLFLVRCLETKLGLASPADAGTALSVLRQVYYGSGTWSRSRNRVWDAVIDVHPWPPSNDPSAPLGKPLLAALGDSQVVEQTDIGHLLTGLDAMMHPHTVDAPAGPIIWGTDLRNEEWATWAGDVGSAAANATLDHYWAAPSGPGPFEDHFKHDASDADLLGDVDSFAVRSGLSIGTAPSDRIGSTLSLRGTLSEMLLEYYRLTGTPSAGVRRRGVRDFIASYGGTMSGTTLVNRPTLFAALRPSVDEFCRLYSIQETAKLKNPTRRAGSPELEPLMSSAIDDMTDRFIDWLVRNVDR